MLFKTMTGMTGGELQSESDVDPRGGPGQKDWEDEFV